MRKDAEETSVSLGEARSHSATGTSANKKIVIWAMRLSGGLPVLFWVW